MKTELEERRERIVLTFDVGTQSSRAMLINNRGDILGKVKEIHDPIYSSPEPGFVEQDPDFYYSHICSAARRLKASLSTTELWSRIEAVTLTTIRDTTICVDKDGLPLRPAIVWLDRRRATGKPAMPKANQLLIKAIRMENMINLQYKKSSCNWIMEHQEEVWKNTHKYMLLSGYLSFKLTGNLVDSAACLVGHLPIDAKRRSWLRKNSLARPIFDVPIEKLCPIHESGQQLGSISKQAASDTGLAEGLPLLASGSDKACEVLGLGCFTQDKAVIGFGTTATITYTSHRYVEPEKYIPPYISIVPGCYNPEIEIFRGYWLISWFMKEFAEKEVKQAEGLDISAEDLLNKRLQEVPPGCDGLLLQPYFTPNVTMPAARGAIIGFSDQHTRIHIYRAIIEGINFALMDGMRTMEQSSGHKFKEILLGGGGSRSSEICQITANMFGLPVVRTQTYETTAIGSALTAFVGMGEFSNYEEAIEEMVHRKDVFEPDMTQYQVYKELYQEIFKNIYGKLSPLYTKLNDIYNRKI